MRVSILLASVLALSSAAFADQGPDYQAGFSAGYLAGSSSCEQQVWTCTLTCTSSYYNHPIIYTGNGFTKAAAYMQLLTTSSANCTDANIARTPANVACTELVGN